MSKLLTGTVTSQCILHSESERRGEELLGGSAATNGLTISEIIQWRFIICGRGPYLSAQKSYLVLRFSRLCRVKNPVRDLAADRPKAQ